MKIGRSRCCSYYVDSDPLDDGYLSELGARERGWKPVKQMEERVRRCARLCKSVLAAEKRDAAALGQRFSISRVFILITSPFDSAETGGREVGDFGVDGSENRSRPEARLRNGNGIVGMDIFMPRRFTLYRFASFRPETFA